MNRRQRIIVSVTGIVIVLLILIGLTYAYFLTRITGNSNPTSISVTTANLELVYVDGTTAILTSETPIEPGKFSSSKDFTVINNGDDSEYVVVFEDITVKYAADTVIDGEAVAKDTPTTFESNDFRYTLTCTVKDKSGNTLSDKSCDGVENETFPMVGGIVVGNNIDKDDVHSYVLTLYYLDNGLDQSADMNKVLNGKVNIKDIKSINPYNDNTESLAYNIINNSMLAKNGTELLSKPLTKPAKYRSSIINYKTTGEVSAFVQSMPNISDYANSTWYYYDTYEVDPTTGDFILSGKHSCNYSATTTNNAGEIVNCYDDMVNKFLSSVIANTNSTDKYHSGEIKKTYSSSIIKVTDSTSSTLEYVKVYSSPNEGEKVLVPTRDDYGTSYYYRGYIEDNYVNFAGMCWRIVRIEGDGSVKLILDDAYAECNDNETDITTEVYTGNWSDGNKYKFGHASNEKASFISYTSTDGLQYSYKTFQKSLSTKISEKYKNETIEDKLKSEEWCYDAQLSTYNGYEYYGAHIRLNVNKKPSLICTGSKLTKFKDDTTMYVGTLTADEVSFAGVYGGIGEINYLMGVYAYEEGMQWWLLSPSSIYSSNGVRAFYVNSSGGIGANDVIVTFLSRSAITLKSGSLISEGEGTKTNPYVIE